MNKQEELFKLDTTEPIKDVAALPKGVTDEEEPFQSFSPNTKIMEQEQNRKYYLSTDGYYFKYRPDKYNPQSLRADLFDTKDRQLDSITVQSNDYNIHLNHTDVINKFEVMVSLN